MNRRKLLIIVAFPMIAVTTAATFTLNAFGQSSGSCIRGKLNRTIGDLNHVEEKTNSSFIHELSSIPKSQMEQALKQVHRDVLNETHFIIPSNDGEAVRAVKILRAANAPHLDARYLPWGSKLDEMLRHPLDVQPWIQSLKKSGVKRVAIFELPAPNLEKTLRENGFEVAIIDHHKYSEYDRANPESSLEQLMKLINWPMSRADEAIAVNDRGYIPGMRKMGLTDDEIRQVRFNDYVGQGRNIHSIKEGFERAKAILPQLKSRSGVYILPSQGGSEIIKEELAIRAGDRVVSSIEISEGKIGFSGDPEMVDAFLNRIDYEALGYAKEDVVKYGGGDPKASMFFGFKPRNPPRGFHAWIPPKVVEAFWKEIERIAGAKENR